jgi:A/G-specific adenine glycosylase
VSPDLQLAVLAWGEQERRDLPWRRTRDPWAILVSEVMLQQTQVDRVVPRHRSFLARFPTTRATASEPLAEVIAEWVGLGYNRRAVRLHGAAVAVEDDHDGRFPDNYAALVRLPGVGPYTARAVLAFAFEAPAVAVVDTNVARVLARLVGRRLTAKEAQSAADAAVVPDASWAWNQSMLDLGAAVCRPRRPACDRCPVAPGCAWFRSGCPSPDPAIGSAQVSTGQPPFAGSDRQGRGRLVAALRDGEVREDDLAVVMGWPDDPGRATRVAATVVADGLAVRGTSSYRTP